MPNSQGYPIVQDLFDRTEAELSKRFSAARPAAFLQLHGFEWVKDAYDRITDVSRVPRKSDSSVFLQTGRRAYAVPTDCWDTFNGIISIDMYNPSTSIGPIQRPLEKAFLNDLRMQYGENWLSPNLWNGCGTQMWFMEDDMKQFSILPVPTSTDAGSYLVIRYVQKPTQPQSTQDLIIPEYEPYIDIIPIYIAGRAAGHEKNGRSAGIFQEFEARLMQKFARSRRSGPRVIKDSKTSQLWAYQRNYRGSSRLR